MRWVGSACARCTAAAISGSALVRVTCRSWCPAPSTSGRMTEKGNGVYVIAWPSSVRAVNASAALVRKYGASHSGCVSVRVGHSCTPAGALAQARARSREMPVEGMGHALLEALERRRGAAREAPGGLGRARNVGAAAPDVGRDGPFRLLDEDLQV